MRSGRPPQRLPPWRYTTGFDVFDPFTFQSRAAMLLKPGTLKR